MFCSQTIYTSSIIKGVPQGSILEPLLFNISTYDIIESSTKVNFIMYADDTTLNSTLKSFGDVTNLERLQHNISTELNNVVRWLDLKVLEKCTKNLIGHSRLAFNNHKSNIDC